MTIADAVAALGAGPLKEDSLERCVWPLFSRVIEGCRRRGEIYLANHSLGRPLDQAAEDVAQGLASWYDRLDESWEEEGWPAAIGRFRTLVARLIGLSRPDCVLPKTSAGQGLRAVLNSFPTDRPIQVVASDAEFDSVEFILKTYCEMGRAEVRWVRPSGEESGVPLFDSVDLGNAAQGADLLVVSAAMFTTGQLLDDLPGLIAQAQSNGTKVLVDVYHATGVVPVEFDRSGADFMIGGSYKYCRGGPGACWLAIRPDHADRLRTLDTGWFAKRDPFAYRRPERPEHAEGGDAWLESTPSPVACCQARSGLEFTLALGVDRIRDYSLRQQAFLRERMELAGIPVFQPARPERFGAFSLLRHPDAEAFCSACKRMGLNTDARSGFVRFGPDLLNSEEELRLAAQIAGRAWRAAAR